MRSILPKAEQAFSWFSEWVGRICAVLLLLLLVNVFYDVVMRYLFNNVSIGMQELEWHLYATIFLLGVAYTLGTNAHVRIDLFYDRMGQRGRAIVDILGTLLFLWPFCFLVAFYGVGFASEAYTLGEQSADPGGLPYRWVIKAMIPLSCVCVLISSIGFMLRSLNRGAPGSDQALLRP